jgi:hypothetical protein
MLLKHSSTLKNHNGFCTWEGFGHMLLLIRNKNHENLRGLLMTSYNDLNIRNKKGVETRMKTIIRLYGKRNEVIS